MHQKDESDNDRLLERLHIVEGMLRSFDEPKLMALIEASADRADAADQLTASGYSAMQAGRILDMSFSRRTLSARADLIEQDWQLRSQLPD